MEAIEAIKFYPLGNSALLVQWGNAISRPISQQVNGLAAAIKQQPFIGFVDVVPAYCSLTILYDVCVVRKNMPAFDTTNNWVQKHVESIMDEAIKGSGKSAAIIEIPVCYNESLGNDLAIVSQQLGIEKSGIISLHSNAQYYIYMQGFVPGFAYMGEVDEQLNMARKNTPIAVKAGAVGIAGRQTGIYPVDSPGGWHILGYTPVKLFDAKKEWPCLLQAGSMLEFKPIGLDEYCTLKGQEHI